MQKVLMMFMVICIVLFGACSGGDADRDENGDTDNGVGVFDGDSVTDVDETQHDSDDAGQSDNETADTDTAETDDSEPVIREPEGIAITAGSGTMSSEQYQMDITVGRPGTGGTMKSDNYSLDLLVK